MAKQMYAFGNSMFGQLGIPGEDCNQNKPQKVDLLSRATKINCGGKHGAFVNDEGLLYTWGDNELSQLGRLVGRKPMIVSSLEMFEVKEVGAGEAHTVVITSDGRMFSFGSNQSGALGCGKPIEMSDKPHVIKMKDESTFKAFKIACGSKFNYAITEGGEVVSWGDCWEGQLGRGDFLKINIPDSFIDTLYACPIVQVACGYAHALLLAVSGEVFSCGANQFGQLGQGDTQKRVRPTLLNALQSKGISQICAGGQHSLALSHRGRVFAWGANSAGQLGHSDTEHHYSPVIIEFFTKYTVKQIAAGSRHTVAIASLNKSSSGLHLNCFNNIVLNPNISPIFVKLNNTSNGSLSSPEEKDHVFSWGFGGSGQLGHGNFRSLSIPTKIEFFEHLHPLNVTCGSEFTFVQVAEQLTQYDRQLLMQERTNNIELPHIDYHTFASLDGKEQIAQLQSKILQIFSSCGSLNASFLDIDKTSENYYRYTSATVSGLNMSLVRQFFNVLVNLYESHAPLLVSVANATGKLVRGLTHIKYVIPSQLRVFLIIADVPWMLQPQKYQPVLEQFVIAITNLPRAAKNVLIQWWSALPSQFFSRQVDIFKTYMNFLLQSSPNDRTMAFVVNILEMLFKANNLHTGGDNNHTSSVHWGNNKHNFQCSKIPNSNFYLPLLNSTVNLKQHFMTWKESNRAFSFCNFPFLLDPATKTTLLAIEAQNMKEVEGMRALLRLDHPFFTITVRRSHVFTDMSAILSRYVDIPVTENGNQQHAAKNSDKQHYLLSDLKKKVFTTFEGESAVDGGGVTRELFHLIVKDIFQSKEDNEVQENTENKATLFTSDPETNLTWFAPMQNVTLQVLKQYKIVGMILGMALYNQIAVNMQFPTALYSMLLDQEPTLANLYNFRPIIAESIAKLKTLSPGQIDDLDLCFALNGFELIPNGTNISVTSENIKQFIELYIQYLFRGPANRQIEALKEGFWLTCSGKVVRLCTPEELELLVCGSGELDLLELKKQVEYISYTPDNQVIQWFWEVVASFSYEEKKKFMVFISGTERAPVLGLSAVRFIIQRAGPHSDLLPSTHTCMYILDLPEYNSKEILASKLLLAINNCSDFSFA